MSHRLGAAEGWMVTRDGETVAGPFSSDGEAMSWMHSHANQSVDWEVRYGGYDIVLVRGGVVQSSYRRTVVEPERRNQLVADPDAAAKEFEEEVRRAFIDVYGEPRRPDILTDSIRSSYSETARRQAWTEPAPNVVLVGSEYGWVEDMFASNDSRERWEQVANLLRARGWPGAWMDSINAGVHVIYWQPQEPAWRGGASLGAARQRRTKPTKLPLSKAERMGEQLLMILEPYLRYGLVVGSIRRQAPVVGDVELVVLPNDLEDFLDLLDTAGFSGGDRKRVGHIAKVPIEVYIAHDPKELGSLVFMYTGDFTFNIAMRMKAKKRGLKLNQYGIWRGDKPVLQSEDEVDFFKFLGVRYHEPRERSLAARVKPRRVAGIRGSEWTDEEE